MSEAKDLWIASVAECFDSISSFFNIKYSLDLIYQSCSSR